MREKHNKRIDLTGRNKSIVKTSSVRGSKRWSSFGKGDKVEPAKTYQIPPNLLTDFLASGLSAQAYLKSCQIEVKPSTIAPKRKLSASVYRPDPINDPSLRNQVERNIVEAYSKAVEGFREVPTEAGNIDFLTSSELIEFKIAHNWKHAIGQLLTYGFYYPNHALVLMLVGSDAKTYLKLAKKHCKRYGITAKAISLAEINEAFREG